MSRDCYALIDVGSNALRLTIVELDADGGLEVLRQERVAVRLGREVFATGRIPGETVARAEAALRDFRGLCRHYGVGKVRAVATAALREARDREQVLDRLTAAAGIEVEVISGEEEARLLVLAVRGRVDLSRGRSLLADLGGGSVEVALVDAGRVLRAGSHPLGCLRLLQEIGDDGQGPAPVARLQSHIAARAEPLQTWLQGAAIDRYLAVGGGIEAFADLAGAGPVLPAARLRALVDELAALSCRQRIDRWGLPPDRADAIVAAGLVHLHLVGLAARTEIHVPRVGLRDGLLLDLAARQSPPAQ